MGEISNDNIYTISSVSSKKRRHKDIWYLKLVLNKPVKAATPVVITENLDIYLPNDLTKVKDNLIVWEVLDKEKVNEIVNCLCKTKYVIILTCFDTRGFINTGFTTTKVTEELLGKIIGSLYNPDIELINFLTNCINDKAFLEYYNRHYIDIRESFEYDRH